MATPYLNTEACWKTLVQASKPARYLRLVPLDAFVDRRNPPASIFAEEPAGPQDKSFDPWTSGGHMHDVWLGEMPEHSLPGYMVSGDVEQRYDIEAWCEKSTMNDVLVPLCRWNDCNLVTGLGEMSIPAVRDLILRIAKIGRPARVALHQRP